MTGGVNLDAARLAKATLSTMLSGSTNVVGIGITRVGESFAVKVNLLERDEGSLHVPTEVNGVPIVVEVVGRIAKRD